MWVFDHCPNSVWMRYGKYQDEETARKAWEKANAEWLANGRFVYWKTT
jgi:hypothetical protein